MTIAYAVLILLELLVIARALLRPHREPASRIAWVVVIAVFPVAGILAYLLFGKTNIGRKRVARVRTVLEALPSFETGIQDGAENQPPDIPDRFVPLFRLG